MTREIDLYVMSEEAYRKMVALLFSVLFENTISIKLRGFDKSSDIVCRTVLYTDPSKDLAACTEHADVIFDGRGLVTFLDVVNGGDVTFDAAIEFLKVWRVWCWFTSNVGQEYVLSL